MSYEVINRIKKAFSDSVIEARSLGEKSISIIVKADSLREAASFIKDELGYDMPVSVGAIDYVDKKTFQVVYYLWSTSRQVTLLLKVNVPRDEPIVPSLVQVWEAVDYHEREAWEMFGIKFKGHPNLAKLFLPEDWKEGFPLRKDFEWGSEE